jgi:hypothetical protein
LKQDRIHTKPFDGARAVKTLTGLLVAYVSAFMAGLVSIYKPHQLPDEPLFQRAALAPLYYVCAAIVVVVWLFARKWSRKTVNIILVSGIGLLVLAISALVIAGLSSADRQSVPMFFAQNLAALAIPCLSVISVVAEKNRKEQSHA